MAAPSAERDKPLFKQAENYIQSLIEQRNLQIGDRIPGRKSLAQTLSVNELTIRRAVSNLIERGILRSQRGKGTFVADRKNSQRILWVCGDDIFSGDISPFYTDFLRFTQQACSDYGLVIEPVFVPNGNPHAAPWANTAQAIQRYAGFIFSSCDNDHSLLRSVADAGLAYSFAGVHAGRPKTVTPNHRQSLELAARHFRQHAIDRVTVLRCHDEFVPSESCFRAAEIEPEFINHGKFRRMSDYETEGYRLMHSVLANGTVPRGLFILDDIVARGATRALLETGLHRTHDTDIVVVCGRQEVIPLGLPITFLVHDTEELATAAVRMVMDQIEGRTPLPPSYTSAFHILSADSSAVISIPVDHPHLTETVSAK